MSDDEVEARATDIEETRNDMTATVEAIGDRLDPANIVQDAKETVRDATVGKVETMAEQASSMMGDAGWTAQSAGSSILTTIREHPVAAAMAGVGLAWLATHRESGMPARRYGDWDRYADRSGRWRADRAWDSEESFRSDTSRRGDRDGGQGSPLDGLQERAGEMADSVGERFGDVGQQVGRVPHRVGGSAEDIGQSAQRLIEESPLAAGAIAVAVGTAIGLSLPSTRFEREMVGPASGRFVEKAEETASQALRDARQQVETSSADSESSTSKSTGA